MLSNLNIRFTICLLLVNISLCFNGHTHVLIARIAYNDLVENDQDALDKATDILKVLSNDLPNITYKEDKHPFVECTTLADDIKYHGGSWQKEWHYIDQPWLD